MPLHRIDNKIVLFVHIPKTGGSTIEAWLDELGPRALKYPGKYEGLLTAPQHFHAALLERIVPADFYDDAFCIVRDPFERILSEYRWRYRRRGTLPTGLAAFLPGKVEEEKRAHHFRNWVRKHFARARRDPLTRGNHIRPQSDFLDVAKCRVYRFEDGFEPIIADLAERWGVPRPEGILHMNATKKTPVQVDLRTRRMIDDFYAKDFDLLGYTKSVDRD